MAGEYFYIVGMLVLIFLQEMMIMLTEEPRTLLPPPSPPLSWLRQERGERMQSDYRAVSRNISLQRLNLARIIIILVLLARVGLAGN